MMRLLTTGLLIACFGFGAPLPAQGGGGGEAEIKRMLEQIQKDMSTIDKLLDQASQSAGKSGGGGGSSGGGGQSASGGAAGGASGELDKLLKESVNTSKGVVEKIDKLLEMSQQQQNNSQSSSSSQQQKRDQQRQNQRQQRRPDDRQNQTPEMVRQQQERERQRRERERQKDGNPDDPRAAQERGKNEKGPKKPDGATERLDKAAQNGDWGRLPPYLQFLFKKRGAPKLPSKYERFREEFHKRADKNRRKR